MLNVEDANPASSRDRARARERRAKMEAAIETHDRVLVRWLTSKFRDPDKARDIAQSAYVRALDYVETTEVESPKALLFKTAANLAANEFRSVSRARRVLLQPDPNTDQSLIETVPCDAPGPERQMQGRQDLEASIRAIETLPSKVRRAFVLSRFEGKSYREIADIMRVSQSSVEKYVTRALKELRAALDAEIGDGKGSDERVSRQKTDRNKTIWSGRKK